jgi:hypothetical protein
LCNPTRVGNAARVPGRGLGPRPAPPFPWWAVVLRRSFRPSGREVLGDVLVKKAHWRLQPSTRVARRTWAPQPGTAGVSPGQGRGGAAGARWELRDGVPLKPASPGRRLHSTHRTLLLTRLRLRLGHGQVVFLLTASAFNDASWGLKSQFEITKGKETFECVHFIT